MDMESQRKCIQNRIQIGRKFEKIELRGCLGALWAPRWPKMRVGSHLGLHLETSWGSSCRQDGPSWAKMTPRWRYVGQLGPQDGQLGSSLGGILAHFSDLERDLRKNSGSVKTSVTMAFWLQIGESGGRVGGSWELCWLMLALC